jgi:hypothetical protein
MLIKLLQPNRTFLMGILLTIILPPCAAAWAQDCSFMWQKIDHQVDKSPAYPEWNTIYWSFTFRKWLNSNNKLTFTGTFFHARYMSYVLYDLKDGNPVDQLLDIDIRPDDGSVNPYLANTPRTEFDEAGNPINRRYTVNVVQEGSPNADAVNTMVIPEDVNNLVILLRIYLPDNDMEIPENADKPSLVTAYNERLGLQTNCPGIFPSESPAEGLTPPENAPALNVLSDQVIWSFRPGEVGLYPNGNNPYLAAPMRPAPNGNMAVLRFLPPKYTKTKNGINMFTGNEEVRYWSVCLSNMEDTTTSKYCFADEDMIVAEDGFIKLAIAPEHIVAEKPAAGWNYIPWTDQERPVLLFRQLEPKDFEGSFKRVNRPDTPEEIEALENAQSNEDILPFAAHADTNIGDYGPHGIYCSEEDFRNISCGY